MKNKKQHVIPNCYLKSWCDPRTPAGQSPYIWRVSNGILGFQLLLPLLEDIHTLASGCLLGFWLLLTGIWYRALSCHGETPGVVECSGERFENITAYITVGVFRKRWSDLSP